VSALVTALLSYVTLNTLLLNTQRSELATQWWRWCQ